MPTPDGLMEVLQSKLPVEVMVERIKQNLSWISDLIDIMRNDRGTLKFYAQKIVLNLSETHPELVYPDFDKVADLLTSPNHFILWGSIQLLGNLLVVDHENRFEAVFDSFFRLLDADDMVTVANVIGSSWKVVLHDSQREPEITRRLLAIPRRTFRMKGEASPECTRVLCGHLIDCFDHYYEQSSDQPGIRQFIREQLTCSRKSVARKAIRFFDVHRIVP